MALTDNDPKKQYTKYKRHVNESNERISADTVNTIQEDVNEQQIETNKIKDKAFEERVYTIFENNLYTNAMFVDTIANGEYINLNECQNVTIDHNKRRITLSDPTKPGKIVSTLTYSSYGPDVELNDFFVISNEETPIGTTIKFYIESVRGERWPILQNSLKLPMHLSNNLEDGFKTIIEISPNATNESPALNCYAILYWDAKIEENLGLTNPDLKRFP